MLHSLEHGVDDNKGTCGQKKIMLKNHQKNNMRQDTELSLTCPSHARAAVSHHGSAVGGVEHVDASGKIDLDIYKQYFYAVVSINLKECLFRLFVYF